MSCTSLGDDAVSNMDGEIDECKGWTSPQYRAKYLTEVNRLLIVKLLGQISI